MNKNKNIVIFASGNGTNAENIIRFFHSGDTVKVVAVFSDNPNAFVLERAIQLNVPCFAFKMSELKNPDGILRNLFALQTDLIVLAGFLRLMPDVITQAFKKKIINIHPALLPKYGGKGMYGHHVHEAVYQSAEKETGITIHYVNEKYDEGEIIMQHKVALSPDDTPQSIAQKIAVLEMKYFPLAIEKVLMHNT
jgi:phosphoribosylglycinamide formyltransferase-1